MNCIIPGNNLKVLSKTLQGLSKIGDELYIEAKTDQLSLITLNTSKTVCGRYNFADTFFTYYQIDNNNNADKRIITCKLHLKVVLPLFKGNLEKKLEYFKIDYDGGADTDFIMFKMKYTCDNIIMEHKLRLMDNETLTIGNNLIEQKPNYLQANSTFYNQLLSVFNIKDDEIIFDINKTKLSVRNYCPGINNNNNNHKLRTQINLNSTEFQIYQINQETIINFSLKPLRTLISFAENFNLNIDLNFNVGNQPIVFVLKNPTFVVDFIVATINPSTNNNNNNLNGTCNTSIFNRSSSLVADKVPVIITTINNNDNDNDDKENDDHGKNSLDSPQSKRAKTVFSRCKDETFHSSILGDVLVENSDSE